MGSYNKHYSIKWIHFYIENNVMVAEYNVEAILDEGTTAKLPSFRSEIKDLKYLQLFSIPVHIWDKDTTLGEFIGYMAASAAQLIDNEFPIDHSQIDKWGNQGKELLDDK